jgi:hypothetical protein
MTIGRRRAHCVRTVAVVQWRHGAGGSGWSPLLGLASPSWTPADVPTASRFPVRAPAVRPDAVGGLCRPGGTLPLPSGAVGVPVRLAEPATRGRPAGRTGGPAGRTDRARRPATLWRPGRWCSAWWRGGGRRSSALYLALAPEQARRAVGLPEGGFAIVVRG